MKLSIEREDLLKPLQLIVGVVEKRQTLPVLGHALIKVTKNELFLTGTDLEIELQSNAVPQDVIEAGTICVSAHKLIDICRVLPEKTLLNLSLEKDRLIVKAGKSRFNLTTLPSTNFPASEDVNAGQLEFTFPQNKLKELLEHTQFAMAVQDVRYYLNGMYWNITKDSFRFVATDGHRLALLTAPKGATEDFQAIIPRKSVSELIRLLGASSGEVDIILTNNQLRVRAENFVFTTKLINGRFPDYSTVIPRNGDKILLADRDELKQAFNRMAILSNEKHRGISIHLQPDLIRMTTHNPDQDEAEEEFPVQYQGGNFEIAFNVNYLIDALNALPAGQVKLTFSDAEDGVLLETEAESDDKRIYVVMPMNL